MVQIKDSASCVKDQAPPPPPPPVDTPSVSNCMCMPTNMTFYYENQAMWY